MEAPQDLTGTMVGRFAIRARLGSGGMGEVYRADDTKLKRSVALKRIASRVRTDERYRQRFLKEAERASRLTDQHIAQIYDVFEANTEIFLVMEYVEGQTLRQCLGRPLGVDRFLEIAVQCAKALDAAHQRNIVHCDIKPENIMLTPAGQVKILDFGIARELPRAGAGATTVTLATEADVLRGTVAYMAPEVLMGKGADGRADIFSLGVVFYEALTGRHPFLAETFVATSDRVLHQAPAPLRELNPSVPPELNRIVTNMLAKDPNQRYSTAGALVLDLDEAQRGVGAVREPLQIGAAGRVEPARRAAGRRPIVLAALALVVALGVLAALPSVRQKIKGWLAGTSVSEQQKKAVSQQQKQLAVLPFQELDGNRETAAFGDGLIETLAAKLNQISASRPVQVVPAGEVRTQGIKTLDQARQELGANLVLQGTLHRAGDMVRVTCILVDASTRRQLRGDTITAPASDPFALEDQVVASALEMLEIELQPQERQALTARGTQQPAAYEYYLRGRGYLQDYYKSENIESSIASFNDALGIDPSYALAYAGLGEAYWRKYLNSHETVWVERSREACKRAVNLDSKLAAAHTCLGTLDNGAGQYEKGVREFQGALQRDPTSDDAYRGLASAYEGLGKLAEAERTYRRSIELRPSYWVGHWDLGAFYWRRGRYAEATARFRAVTELVPDNPRPYSLLGGMYHMMGQNEQAIRMLRKSLEIRPTPSAYTNLGVVYHYQGRYRDAVPMMEKAVDLDRADYHKWGNLAETYNRIPEFRAKAPDAYRQAARLAQRELTINPKDAEVRAWLAQYWVKLGKKEEALTEIERARRLAPTNVNVLFRAAVVYEVAGKRDRALSVLKSAIESGYSIDEIRTAADLAELRKDPRYQRLLERQLSH